MVRRHSLRYLLVLALSLVMTAGMVAPAIAESENDTVVVTAQVLPYLEVSTTPASLDFGSVPSVWNPAEYASYLRNWWATRPFTVSVTSNLPYGTMVEVSDGSTGLSFYTHFVVYLSYPRSDYMLWSALPPGTSRDAEIGGGPALNSPHAREVALSLQKNAMPIPPGIISYTLIFTVTQVI
jgi:hypothetical protein